LAAVTEGRNTAGIPFPPPLAYIAALGAGFTLQHFVPVHLAHTATGADALEVAGALLAAASLAFVVGGFVSLRRAGTSPRPDRPTTALAVGGVYRFTRNPLYLSLTLLHAGVSLFANALWPLLFLLPAVLVICYVVIAREERYLAGKFGAEYEAYRRSVRRWL
jgi:protein-S-isoprenylcysteine O-methyltransferase Ste14